jgi:hypothetical protein
VADIHEGRDVTAFENALRWVNPIVGLVILMVAIPQVWRLWWTVAAEVRFKNLALLFWVFVAAEGTVESLYLHIAPGPRTVLVFMGMTFTCLGYGMPKQYRQYPRKPRRGATIVTVVAPPTEETP